MSSRSQRRSQPRIPLRRNTPVQCVIKNMPGSNAVMLVSTARGRAIGLRHVGLKFLEKAPGYVAPPPKEKLREPNPGFQKKKRGKRSNPKASDRGSSYDASGSEAEFPHRNRRRHRSNRVKVVEEVQENPPMKGAGSSNSDSLPLWEPSQKANHLFVNRIRVMEKDVRMMEQQENFAMRVLLIPSTMLPESQS